MLAGECHVGIKYREFTSDERPAIKLVEAPGDVISGLTKNDVVGCYWTWSKKAFLV